jgi:hypothetical protein
VHCVIIGFAACDPDSKTLFDYESPTAEPHRVEAKNINPYLIDALSAVIGKRLSPLCDAPEMIFGTKLVDDGHLIFTAQEKEELASSFPNIAPYFRVLMGGEEFLNNTIRWCLWLTNADPQIIRSCPPVLERIDKVKRFRLASKKAPTVKLAATPSIFGEIRQPDSDYLLIPKVSSEKRLYLPIGFCGKAVIASGSALVVPNATLYHFGVLSSLMHNSWMRHTCGRLESRYQYSASIVYNNFPWPATPSDAQVKAIEEKARSVLDARAQFPNSTLADLYDPLTMPPPLLKAHQPLDKAVDAAYLSSPSGFDKARRKQPFTSERERIEYLFTEYQRLTAPLIAPDKKKRTRKQA